MKEFEIIGLKKGLVKAEVLSKTASDESIDLNPSGNLIIDMLNLAEGLRVKGFDKQAEELEVKVMAYKTAETHLYNAIDEDADDMLDFAHPKKNKVKFEAKDGHGDFEDTRSQHEKMLAIVNKKVASDMSNILGETAEILGLKKKADLDETGKKIELVNYYKTQLAKFIRLKNAYYSVHYESFGFSREGDDNTLSIGTDDYEYVLIEGGHGNWDFPKKDDIFESKYLSYFNNSNNIIDEKLEDLKSGNISFKDLFSPDDKKHANDNLTNLYKTFYDKVDGIPALSAQSSQDEINKVIVGVKSLWDENSWFIIKGLTNNDGKLENQIRDCATKMENAAASLKLVGPKNTANGMDEVLDSGWAQLISNRFNSIFTAATNAKDSDPSYFKKLADIISSGANKPYKDTYAQLVQFDKDLSSATDKNKLDLWAQEWQKHFSKTASNKSEIVKEARVPGQSSGPTQPASFSRPVSNQVHQNAPVKTNFESQFPKEYAAVSDMQEAIHKLADNLPALFKGTAPNSIQNMQDILKGTGYGEKGSRGVSIDGEWGPATQKALESTQAVLTQLKQNVKLTTPAQRNQGKIVNPSLESADIAKLATANTNEIYEALEQLGKTNDLNSDVKDKINSRKADKTYKPGETGGEEGDYFDQLPTTKIDPNVSNIVEDKNSDVLIGKDNLSSLNSLYLLLRRSRLIDENLTPNDWEKYLAWFMDRAGKQLIKARNDGDKYESQIKGYYRQYLNKLYSNVQNYIGSHKDSADKPVLAKDIDGGNSGQTVPATYSKNTGAEGGDVGSVQNVNNSVTPPFGYTFVPADLHRSQFGSAMNAYGTYAQYINDEIEFNVNDFGYDPMQIVNQYMKGLTSAQILALNHITAPTPQILQALQTEGNPFATNIKKRAYLLAMYAMCNGLSNDLYNVLVEWKKGNPPGESLKYIYAAWNKWSNALKNTIGRIEEDLQENGPAPSMGIR